MSANIDPVLLADIGVAWGVVQFHKQLSDEAKYPGELELQPQEK